MIAQDENARHQEVWLLLPWLANGRLTGAEREMAEDHLRQCQECGHELALQQRMCSAFMEPDRVTYAPGPSFRKLMDRIDGEGKSGRASARTRVPQSAGHRITARLSRVSLWRPPGLAWAASFLLIFGVTAMMATAYRWSQPVYVTKSDPKAEQTSPSMLRIALDRSLSIGEVEEMLRTGGGRIVEGPDNLGVLGVAPVGIVAGQTSTASANKQLRALSARLRTDPRVLWVQPLADQESPADQRAPDAQEH